MRYCGLLLVGVISILAESSAQSENSVAEDGREWNTSLVSNNFINDSLLHTRHSSRGHHLPQGVTKRASDNQERCNDRFQNVTSLCNCSSCEGHCGMSLQSEQMPPSQACSCDAQCIAFNDCCFDFPTVCSQFYPTPQQQKQQKQLSTRMMCSSHKKPMTGIYNRVLINACLSGEACPFIFHKITDKVNSHSRPVVDMVTGLHYVNYACSVCNNAVKIIPWDVSTLLSLIVQADCFVI